MSYENILVERHDDVGLVTLNRPEALNALNSALLGELAAALAELEGDDAIGAIVLTVMRRYASSTEPEFWARGPSTSCAPIT